jgi:5'-nucleotidase
MNILLTNDDGIKADGIRILAEALKKNHNLIVVAPSRERSGASHSTTFGKALYLEEYAGIKGVRAYSFSGKPADCVKFGLNHFDDFNTADIDLVIAGINKGANIGTDIIYSGTVSAALEAALSGANALAVSSAATSLEDFEFSANFINDKLDFFVKHKYPFNFWNINIPSVAAKIKGVKFVKHGIRKYNDSYVAKIDERGKEYYILDGEPSDYDDADEDCDVKFFKKNFITITPLLYNRTNFNLLKDVDIYKL